MFQRSAKTAFDSICYKTFKNGYRGTVAFNWKISLKIATSIFLKKSQMHLTKIAVELQHSPCEQSLVYYFSFNTFPTSQKLQINKISLFAADNPFSSQLIRLQMCTWVLFP